MKQFLIVATILLVFFSCKTPTPQYIQNSGLIFGTYYQLTYENQSGEDFHAEVKKLLHELDLSFSTYNPLSTVSKVNQNQSFESDSLFTNVFNKSLAIASLTNGAFDPTVAPLVNAWGFGFKEKKTITPEIIDSIMAFIGYQKVRIEKQEVVKTDSRLMLDFSAIAKGYSVDLVAHFLIEKGCRNVLVDIGGEVVAFGKNPTGINWRIGINQPNDDEPMNASELQAIVSLKNKAMATSGNYRNFYIENGQKYAHTIDPRNGFPVNHNLLSVTILANDCMTADALATACMVLGVDSAQKLITKLDNIEAFLIYSDSLKQNQIFMTNGFRKIIINE